MNLSSSKLWVVKTKQSFNFLQSLFGIATFIILFISCAVSEENKMKESVNLNYAVAKGYFVKNTFSVQQPTPIILANKAALDSIMGMAATMGVSGKPTDFDFSHEYAIAFIYPETDISVVLHPGILELQANTAKLSVRIDPGVKQTYRMVPMLLLKVSGTAPARIVWENKQ
ncbi:MAG: hypothetical protein NTZ47_11865 [Bacteroidetes bacterium]|nr:hypothetical protein [Bacteroidota bacterium]